ncbi:MAG TPA: hypothetical protein DCW29_00795 [Janthinobacterium sp.]|nr:hypothetical protein [Janthinobacterium sp.]
MKILYVADARSIHTRRWAEHFRDRGAEVHVASFRDAEIAGVTVHALPTWGMGQIGYFIALFRLRKLYRTLAPDIVHAQYVTSYGFLAALAGLKPLIVTAWGTDVLISPKESRVMRFLARYALRHANAVTTVAEHMNGALVELGCSPSQVVAIPFGVDAGFFVPRVPGAPPNETPKIICTRNFGPVYDVGTLLRALAVVVARGHRVTLDLVGEGPLGPALRQLTDELGLRSHVSFHGHVEHAVLATLLAGADIFVSPALSDGNNVSLNEAMACGCFPIATDIPANSQWIEDGRNGYLYPAGDAATLATVIERALGAGTLIAAAKVENRRIVETRADWRVCVAKMEAIYARLDGKRTP